jgi:hypothetical protein
MSRPPPSLPSRWLIPFGLAALAAAGGCTRADSIILVEVAQGAPLDSIVQLGVTMSVGVRSKSLLVPPTPGAAIALPTSFSVNLDPFLMGTITISIDALDAAQVPVASGTAVQEHFEISGQTVVTVILLPPTASPPDGGGN